ncbi:hypothetical protein GTR02_12925 [Kineococcus sp. R8]|uniref:hypothetical protein n=1 Tax=Kineococcus siccus TaxID=2696567 RepID=UPI001411B919|nr:hypothetical protein [Kineococcus siccus]NAZ82724.1 hypothetical protein [Kineococcus siccus]
MTGPEGPREGDEALRALLRRADPARDLLPLEAEHVHTKGERVMAIDEQEQVRGAGRERRPARRRFVAAAAGFAVAASVATVFLTAREPAPTTTFTTAVADPSASCAVLTPEALAQRQTAFEAEVTAVAGQQVTLEVLARFKGDVDDRVVVRQPAEGQDDSSAVPFVAGERYLLAADGGVIAGCGASGPAGDDLRSLYDRAFA